MAVVQQDGGATGGFEYQRSPARRETEPAYFLLGPCSRENHTGQRPEHESSPNVCYSLERGLSREGCSDMELQQTVTMHTSLNNSRAISHCACGSVESIINQRPYCVRCLQNKNNSTAHLAATASSGTQQLQDGARQAEEDETNNTLFHILPWYDVIFAHLCRCLTLQEVFWLRATCRVARDCINEYFTMCPRVNLTQCSLKVTPNAFRMVTYNNYRLHTLILRGVKIWLTDDVLIPAFATSSHLTKVDLTDCSSLTPRSVVALAIHARTLQELYLRECGWVTKECVVMVAQCCPDLLKLDLTGCWAVDDETVVTISICCQRLTFLSIAKIYGVTDFSVRCLSQNCPLLQHVNMHGCWRVSDAAIHLLGEHCKQLRVLQVRECREVTERSLARLRKRGVMMDVQNPNRMFLGSSRNLLENLKLQV